MPEGLEGGRRAIDPGGGRGRLGVPVGQLNEGLRAKVTNSTLVQVGEQGVGGGAAASLSAHLPCLI